MRKAILCAVFLIATVAAFDASACSQCITDEVGCSHCYESGYDGADDCVLQDGEWCNLINDGGCEGYLERWCPGGHCPDDQIGAHETGPDVEWVLASVEVIRPES